MSWWSYSDDMDHKSLCKQQGDVKENWGGVLSRGQPVISSINKSIVTAVMLFGWGQWGVTE